MKRSEVIKDITNILNDPWTFLEPEEYAEKVLGELEKLGMLPPTIRLKYYSNVFVNQWEPEDEKNQD